MVEPPTTFPNPRKDHPWDSDAISWLLTHPDVAAEFDRLALFECARRQPRRLENDLERVLRAAHLCGRYGVEQLEVFDRKIGKTIWRLRRTDPDAPDYPNYEDGRDGGVEHRLEISQEDRASAERLMALLPSYELELREAGKSPNTVFTYVDRAERFLRRVLEGAKG